MKVIIVFKFLTPKLQFVNINVCLLIHNLLELHEEIKQEINAHSAQLIINIIVFLFAKNAYLFFQNLYLFIY